MQATIGWCLFACNLEENAGIHSFASKQNLMRMVGPEKRLHEIQKYLRTIFAKQESFLVKKEKKRRTFLPLRFTSL